MTQNLVIKTVRRNIPLDAGFSYLDRDIPAEVLAEIEPLAFPASLSQVEIFQSRAQALFQATMDDYDRGE